MANRTVSVALVADVGQYQSAMVRAASSTKAVGDTAVTAGGRAERGFASAGRGGALLAGVLGGAVALGLKNVVNAASEAKQSLGGAQAVFKGYARQVIASSEEADRALGLSANSYRELATIIGSQMKNAGVPLSELADKTEDIIGIGADLAAQFGGSTQQAVEALSSAFRGELDPIERYGISLTAAAVGAKAVEMGLAESATELSQNAKAMATLAIITEQSADAQGAFAREADTAAGRAQRASASWDNLKVTLGNELLPLWSALVDVLGEAVIPALGQVIETGGDVVGFLRTLWTWVGDNTPLAAALGAVLAIQLAGGLTAVQVAANRLILTPVVLGLSSMLGAASALPGALSAAAGALGTLAAAVAPLVAIGAVVWAIGKTIEFAGAAGEARAEINEMWSAVEDARGAEQLSAAAGLVDQLSAKIRSLNEELPKTEGAFQGLLSPLGMLENGDSLNALDEYEDALTRAREQQEQVERTAGIMGTRFSLTGDQVLDLASKYNIDLSSGVSNVFRLFQNYYSMEYGAKPTEATFALTEATIDAKDAMDEAKDAVDAFKLSLDILSGAHVSMIQVESAFEAAVAEADGALKDMTGSVLNAAGGLNMQSESGRAAADVLLDVRDSGNQLIATMIQQGRSAEEVRAKDAQLRESFINSAMQMGINRQAAENLADQILGIPSERETKIEADTKAANDKIADLQRQIDNMRGRTVDIGVRVAGGTNKIFASMGSTFEASGSIIGANPMSSSIAKVVPPGTLRVIGDNPVADEAFIPLNGSSRSQQILGEAASRMGYGLMPMAAGGIAVTAQFNTHQVDSEISAITARMQKAADDGIAGSGAVGGAWGSLWQFVKARVPQARINSTFRAGDPGYHGRGKAIDFGFGTGPGGAGSAGLALINRVLHDGVGRNLAELIYDGIGDDRPDLKNGRPLTYSAGTRAAHRNHVHAAVYDQGGLWPSGTAGINLSGATERVLNPKETAAYEAGLRAREFSGAGGRGGGSQVVINSPITFAGPVYGEEHMRQVAASVVEQRDAVLARNQRSWQ